MSKQKVIICNNLKQNLYTALSECPHDKLFILVDEHTQHLCLPLINAFEELKQAEVITIGAGDIHKNLETLAHVWGALGTRGATRHSLMINLGGGMVTDLGGFAASTFKRGIPYIYGGICGFEGQVSVFPNDGTSRSSYRTLYPDEAATFAMPHPSKAVIGVTPGIVGCVEAAEAIKLICHVGEPLVDRLWTIDLRTMQTYLIDL